MDEKSFEYEGYKGTVNYDKRADYYTGEVVIGGRIYTYEGDTLEELREDFEDIIDSMIAFDEMDPGDDESDDADEDSDNDTEDGDE
jgi:predicted HicB family RNase H-like nuclease